MSELHDTSAEIYQAANAEISALRSQLEEAKEIIRSMIGNAEYHGETGDLVGSATFYIRWKDVARARSFLKENGNG